MKTKQLFFFILLFFTIAAVQAKDSFDGVTGGVWLDTDGNTIQAHGGQVQKIGDKWWWIGENRDGNRDIKLYSSDDLYNWKSEGSAMRALSNRNQLDSDPYFVALYGDLSSAEKDVVYQAIRSNAVIERPKLIYNASTRKYIIWFHADDSNYGAAAAGVAISDNITGPYKFIKRSRLHQLPASEYHQPNEWYEEPANRGMARDMNLFADDDGKAYIIYSSEENRTTFISRLNEEYTDLDVPQTPVGLAKNGVDFIRLFPGAQREAPALFKYDGKYYLITSGATGWDPNQARYWVADEIFGEWKDKGDPCISELGIPYPANLTFRTQSTNVIPVDPANGQFIYMGDRWNSGNLKDSRYIWLPVIFTPTGDVELRSISNWNFSLFETINQVKLKPNQFTDIYYRDEDLPTVLQVEVRGENGWEDDEISITWNTAIENLPPASLANIYGSFETNGTPQTLSVRAVNIPETILYFIDSGATNGSDLYDKVLEIAPYLMNTNASDQAFDENTAWGYTGKIGVDMDYKNSESKDAFSSGWWAYGGKTIDYKLALSEGEYRLTAGFQEWWDTGRDMRISLLYQNKAGNNINKTLGDFYNRTESTQDYSFVINDLNPENFYVTIQIAKTGNPDPVISWFSLTSLDMQTSIDKIVVLNHTNTLKIYPNPVEQSHAIWIEVDANNEWLRDTYIVVKYVSGQIVKQQKTTGKRNLVDLQVPSGIYIIHLKDKYAKIIVK